MIIICLIFIFLQIFLKEDFSNTRVQS